MRKFLSLFALSVIVAALTVSTQGCKSEGSREFIPGKGWRKT